MVTSFADGSKISFEQAIVANATGFKVRSRGMSRGVKFEGSIMDIARMYDVDEVRRLGGIVDYTVGPALTKVFCLAEHDDPKQRHYLNLYKMGEGPLYSFFTPYHLCHFEVPNAIARAVLFRDSIAGLTEAQFKAKVKSSLDARDLIADLELQLAAARVARANADAANLETVLQVVNSVKGDSKHGEDGALYASFGYIRKSDRKSGLTRNVTQPANAITTPVTLKVAA
jgi:hypothetical protein